MLPPLIVLRTMLLLLLGLLLPTGPANAGYTWGLGGTNDIVQRTERDLTQSGDPITKQRWYVTDLDSSVVATVSQTGAIVERVSYTPFGEVRHHPSSDLNGDGKVDFNDQLLLVGNWGNSGLGDISQDGVVNLADQLILQAQFTSGLAPGGLSTDGNTIGFTAHIYDVESGLLLARFRVYDAQLGRWLSPDPASFVDGMNLYLYVRGNPLMWWDPLGLWIFEVLGLTNDQNAPGARTTGWDRADAFVRGFVSGLGEGAADSKRSLEIGLKTTVILGGVSLGLVDEQHLADVPLAAAMMDRVFEGTDGSLLGDFAELSLLDPMAEMWRAIRSGDPDAIGAALRNAGLLVLTRNCVRGRGDWSAGRRDSAGSGTRGAETPRETLLPDSYWINRDAQTQVTPGTRTVNIDKPSRSGGTYHSTTHYDDFGRQIGQTHRTHHGYGNPSSSQFHPNPHHHRRDPVTGERLRDPRTGSRTWPGLFGNDG